MNGGITSHIGKIIWKLPIPKKCKIFNWICFHNKALSVDNLVKKGLNRPSRCCLCYNSEKNANHLFLKCKYSYAV